MIAEKTEFKFDPNRSYTREEFIFGFEAIAAQNSFDAPFVEEMKKHIEWARKTVAENEIIKFDPETLRPYSVIEIGIEP